MHRWSLLRCYHVAANDRNRRVRFYHPPKDYLEVVIGCKCKLNDDYYAFNHPSSKSIVPCETPNTRTSQPMALDCLVSSTCACMLPGLPRASLAGKQVQDRQNLFLEQMGHVYILSFWWMQDTHRCGKFLLGCRESRAFLLINLFKTKVDKRRIQPVRHRDTNTYQRIHSTDVQIKQLLYYNLQYIHLLEVDICLCLSPVPTNLAKASIQGTRSFAVKPTAMPTSCMHTCLQICSYLWRAFATSYT